MFQLIAQWLVWVVLGYAAVGLLFGLPFVWRWVDRIDPNAKGGTVGFRVLILPGVVALWPLLWKRMRAGSSTPPIERNAHRDAARELHGEPSETS